MNTYIFKNKKLYCEGVGIESIAKKTGTPFYVYGKAGIKSNHKELNAAMSGIPHLICFACKANSNISILKILKNLGAGADIVSGGELYKVLKAGINPKKIVFAGTGKTEDELRYAIGSGILMINVESMQELNLINEIAGRMKKKAQVAIRVNFALDPDTHAYINTSKGTKFGIDVSRANGVFAYAKALRNIEILGLHSHIGSQITDAVPFRKNLEMALSFISGLRALGIKLRYVNLGGGFGISYREGESLAPVKKIGGIFRKLLEGSGLTLVIEPGRFIICNSCALITKVLYTKESFNKKFVIVDAGMNDLIRPSLYGAYHRVISVNKSISQPACAEASAGRQVNKVNIVGPICETGDFLALDRKMPIPQQGDLLAVMEAGAYGFEMSSNYCSRRRIAQVLVSKNKFSVIRKRDTYEDLVRGE